VDAAALKGAAALGATAALGGTATLVVAAALEDADAAGPERRDRLLASSGDEECLPWLPSLEDGVFTAST